ncbi:dipeptide epimerase [Streptomyces sp. NBRC 109706]|uniref:mandelate racemase/muconate lactonizing enzyme family protein n=1 Tax=Streptomyces sp. NBRC 109706 TaxID=1550035 RepID=UPI0007840DA8
MALETRVTVLELSQPLRISRATMSRREAVWVALRVAGEVGYGELLGSRYLGVRVPEAIGTLRRQVAPALARQPTPEAALTALRADRLLPAEVSAPVRAAVEAALLDLWGRSLGQPVHRLLGTEVRPSAPTARTVGMVRPKEAAAQARWLVARGFRLLKVKAGSPDPEEDLARIGAVLTSAPGARVLVDANGAWTVARAASLLPRLAELGVEAVEQPTVPGVPEELARLAERSPLPLIADEDAAGLAEVRRLAGRVQGVNVKLAQCGGVYRALEITAALAGSGTRLMLGCQAGSSLSIAPAVHLVDRARWVDLDGHLLLAHDPWRGVGGADGTVGAGTGPGLGVRPAAGQAEGGQRAHA